MYAVLLNPPRRTKRKRKSKTRSRRRRRKLKKRGGFRYRRRKGKYVRVRKTKRRRRRRKMSKATRARRRKRGARKAVATRARRKCARKVRKTVRGVICGPTKRYRKLRKRCRTGLGALTPAQEKWERARASNPRRRRRRRSGRRRRRNYSHWIPAYKNPAWVPSYAMNPAPRTAMAAITSGFRPDPLMKTLPVVGGALGNAVVVGMVADRLPSMFQEGPGNLALGLATAGLLSAGVGMASPRLAQGVFLGGVIEVVTRGVREYVLPMIPGMSGLGDYLTRTNVAEARPLGCYGGMCGYADSMETGAFLPSFAQATGLNRDGVPSYAQASGLNPYKFGMQGMGDYLTRTNVAEARPLGAYRYNDLPIEGAAAEELNFGF